MAKSFFIKLQQSQEVEDFILNHPKAFAILSLIAVRVRRSRNSFNTDGLEIGEAYIGQEEFDHLNKNNRISRQECRTFLNTILTRFLTIKSTNKGTIVKFKDSSIYDINLEKNNQQINQQSTSNQPLTENIEYRNISSTIVSDINAGAQEQEKILRFGHDDGVPEKFQAAFPEKQLEKLKQLYHQFSEEEFNAELRKCISYFLEKGKVTKNWPLKFRNWLENALKYRKESAAKFEKEKKNFVHNFQDAGKHPINPNKIVV